MRDGWEKVAISDVCIMIKRGQAPSYTENKSVTVLNQKCIRDGRINLEFSRQTDANLKPVNEWAYLNATDTLVNSTGVGTLGRVAFVRNLPEPTTVDSHVTIVRPDNKKVEPSFLGLSLNFREADIEGLAAGSSGQTELSREALGNLIITLPTLPEQKRIVDLISSVDIYVEALQQNLETARNSRNAVLHELLNASGDDWVKTKLGKHIEINTGKLDVNAASEFGEYPFFTCSRETYRIKEAAFEGESVIVAGNGDLNVKYFDGKFNAYQRTYVLNSVNKDTLDNRFLFLFMQRYIDFLRSETRGSVIQYLKKGQFTEAGIHLPPLSEQKRIVDIISTMSEATNQSELTLIKARNLRVGLLFNLLSGEHEIPASYDKVIGAA